MPCGCRSVQVGRAAPFGKHACDHQRPHFCLRSSVLFGFWIIALIKCVAHSGEQLTGWLRVRLEVSPIVYVRDAYQGFGWGSGIECRLRPDFRRLSTRQRLSFITVSESLRNISEILRGQKGVRQSIKNRGYFKTSHRMGGSSGTAKATGGGEPRKAEERSGGTGDLQPFQDVI